MNKRPFILAANWKMNPLTFPEADRLSRSIEEGVKRLKKPDFNRKVEIILCPPSIFLGRLKIGKYYNLGIQNIHWETRGAYTGEIAIRMAEDAGAHYAIMGHSERRKMFGETDQTVNFKLKSLLKTSINPIICVGENLEEREEGNTTKVISRQIRRILDGISILLVPKIIIAYEPVWAISSMQNNTSSMPDDPNNVMGITILIRKLISEMYRPEIADKISVIYGGSVNSKNVKGFLDIDILDGLLVGGASLSTLEFLPLVRKAYER